MLTRKEKLKKFWEDANKGTYQYQINNLENQIRIINNKLFNLESLRNRDIRFLDFLEITKKRVEDKQITDIEFLIDHIRNGFDLSPDKNKKL